MENYSPDVSGGTLPIKSVDASARLVLSHLRPAREPHDGGIGSYWASLTDVRLSAEAEVVTFGDDGLAAFMHELASEWRGWAGPRWWGSLEGQLELSATADRLGHIQVNVLLRPDVAPGFWEARAVLLLEAGGLDALARDMSGFFGRSAGLEG